MATQMSGSKRATVLEIGTCKKEENRRKKEERRKRSEEEESNLTARSH
jgi:hypothetical protein